MAMDAKYQVCVITSTRADYGLLRELLYRFRENQKVELKLVVTGSHLCAKFGNTQEEIIRDGFTSFERLDIPMDDDSREGMALSAGIAMTKFTEYFSEHKPDIVVVLGDRFEILSAVSAAHLIGIPIAHISGGDITEGAVDDAIRHCITKMSYLHFPGCQQSAMRIIQMGEQPDRVFNVGEPGVENCLKLDLLSREELAQSIDFEAALSDFSVVTFHPVTMENDTAELQVRELIKAMESINDMAYIITMANADTGGRAINNIWIEEGRKHPNWLVVSSLGVLRYLSAVKYAKLVIGNSSSGIVEAPSMGTPTINIGDRQKGRMMADSVLNCIPHAAEITLAIDKGMSGAFQELAKHVNSPFGDGTTSMRIETVIMEYLKNHIRTNEKHFYDINFTI